MKLFGRKAQKRSTGFCSVIVAAAGSSSRMGRDKLMAELGGQPVFLHCLRTFEAAVEVDEVIVVTREELVPEVARLCRAAGLVKVAKVVRGGASRTQSVRLGTLEASKSAELIAIHDGARPFVTPDVIRAVVERAAQTGAAAPAIPVKDTIKIARNGLVEQTPERDTLYAIQTPQVFEASLIRAALQKALDDGAELTDDCGAVERLGMKVSLTQGDERNIKLTTPADLLWAESFLEADDADRSRL